MFRLLTFLVCIILSVSGCSTDEKEPSTDKAKRYEVIENTAVGLPGTKKRRATILSREAKGHDELAQTVIKAALDLQRQDQADSIEVFLVPLAENLGDGRLYAKAENNPGANKVTQKWDVKAAERVLSEDELSILSRLLQFENKRSAIDEIDVNKLSDNQFQIFNERKIREEEKEPAKIAKERGISVERIDKIALPASTELKHYDVHSLGPL